MKLACITLAIFFAAVANPALSEVSSAYVSDTKPFLKIKDANRQAEA